MVAAEHDVSCELSLVQED